MSIKIDPKIIEKITPLIQKINERNIYYILGGMLVVVLILDFVLILSPQLASISKIGAKIETVSGEYKTARENIEKTAFYVSESGKLKTKFSQMSARIKSRVEVPLILERISRLALKNNIKIDRIVPDLTKQKEMLKEKDRVYYALPITIDSQGNFHNFGRFLNELESDELFLMVNDLTVASGSTPSLHSIRLIVDSVIYDKPIKKD